MLVIFIPSYRLSISCRSLNGSYDVYVTSATAEVATDGIFDLPARGVGKFLQQLGAGHDEAWRAIPTLHGIFFDEGPLNRMERVEISPMRQPFDGLDVLAVSSRCGHQASHDGNPVQVHGT